MYWHLLHSEPFMENVNCLKWSYWRGNIVAGITYPFEKRISTPPKYSPKYRYGYRNTKLYRLSVTESHTLPPTLWRGGNWWRENCRLTMTVLAEITYFFRKRHRHTAKIPLRKWYSHWNMEQLRLSVPKLTYGTVKMLLWRRKTGIKTCIILQKMAVIHKKILFLQKKIDPSIPKYSVLSP